MGAIEQKLHPGTTGASGGSIAASPAMAYGLWEALSNAFSDSKNKKIRKELIAEMAKSGSALPEPPEDPDDRKNREEDEEALETRKSVEGSKSRINDLLKRIREGDEIVDPPAPRMSNRPPRVSLKNRIEDVGPNFRLKGKPQTKDFVRVEEVPSKYEIMARESTLPELYNAPKRVSTSNRPPKVDSKYSVESINRPNFKLRGKPQTKDFIRIEEAPTKYEIMARESTTPSTMRRVYDRTPKAEAPKSIDAPKSTAVTKSTPKSTKADIPKAEEALLLEGPKNYDSLYKLLKYGAGAGLAGGTLYGIMKEDDSEGQMESRPEPKRRIRRGY